MWTLLAVIAVASDDAPVSSALDALARDRPLQAEALLVEATEADTGDVDAWWALGWVRYTTGHFDAALDAWHRVAQLRPEHPEVSLWLSAARARAAYHAAPISEVEVDENAGPAAVRIAAVGDLMMGSDLRGPAGLPPGDGTALFDGVRPLLVDADLTFANLEGTLADGLSSGKCAAGAGPCYAFRTPTRFAPALKAAGIDVVSLANNHAMDLGDAGQRATMETLQGVGIAHTGRYGDVASVRAGELSVAVIGAHSGTCCLSVNDLDEVRAAVALADRTHDLVILSFHGGAEGYQHRHVPGTLEIAWGERRGDVTALAHAAIDAGADLVLGHGPHVLRAMEVYRGRLVAYSLGNFLGYKAFASSRGYGHRTVALHVTLSANGALVGAKLHPLALSRDAVPRVDPAGLALEDVRELSAADFPDTGVTVAPDGTLSWQGG
ncbi:MAG: CapA family protein [Myxococcales bacterium]|nr:CapA family protein [Myxococcales bacterium]